MYDFIKDRLKKMGKTQKELAEYLGIQPPHVSAIFSGIRLIKASEIVPIAKFLKIDIADFAKLIAGEIKEDEIKDENCENYSEEELEIIKAIRKAKEISVNKNDSTQENAEAG